MLDSSVTTRHCACLKEFMVFSTERLETRGHRSSWERHLLHSLGSGKNFQKEVQRHGSNAESQCQKACNAWKETQGGKNNGNLCAFKLFNLRNKSVDWALLWFVENTEKRWFQCKSWKDFWKRDFSSWVIKDEPSISFNKYLLSTSCVPGEVLWLRIK